MLRPTLIQDNRLENLPSQQALSYSSASKMLVGWWKTITAPLWNTVNIFILRNCILEELLNVLNILRLFQRISNLLHCYYQVLLSSSTQLESSLPNCQLRPVAYTLYEHLWFCLFPLPSGFFEACLTSYHKIACLKLKIFLQYENICIPVTVYQLLLRISWNPKIMEVYAHFSILI